MTDEQPGAQMLAEISKMPEKLEATGQLQAIVPHNLEEGFRMAQLVVRAGLAPDSYDNKPEKVVIGIMKGMEVGLPPLTALSNIAIINGRPSIWGDAGVALAQAKGLIRNMTTTYEGDYEAGDDDEPKLKDFGDNYVCIVRIWRQGQDGAYEGRFSVKDAKRAKLWANPKKQPWMLYPKRMLFNRARAFALRDGFADALAGLAIAEEMQDLPAPPPEKPETSFLDSPTPTLVSPAAAPAEGKDGPSQPVPQEVVDAPESPEEDEATRICREVADKLSSATTEAQVMERWERNLPTLKEVCEPPTIKMLERQRDTMILELREKAS